MLVSNSRIRSRFQPSVKKMLEPPYCISREAYLSRMSVWLSSAETDQVTGVGPEDTRNVYSTRTRAGGKSTASGSLRYPISHRCWPHICRHTSAQNMARYAAADIAHHHHKAATPAAHVE